MMNGNSRKQARPNKEQGKAPAAKPVDTRVGTLVDTRVGTLVDTRSLKGRKGANAANRRRDGSK